MAYTDFTGKEVLSFFGPATLAISEDVSAGDLLTTDGYKAVNTTSKRVAYIALEDAEYSSAGGAPNTCRVARGAVFRKTPTTATGGGVSRGDHGGSVGNILYLSATAGRPTVTQASNTAVVPQIVGYVLEQDTIFLAPDGDVRGYSQVLTDDIDDIDEKAHIDGNLYQGGNLALVTDKFTVTASNGNTLWAGTLAVTGAQTFTGLTTMNNDLTIAAKNTLGFASTQSTASANDISTWAFTQLNYYSTSAVTLKTFTPAAGELYCLYDRKGGANHISSGTANLNLSDNTKLTSTGTGSWCLLFGTSATGAVILSNQGWTAS